MVPTLIGADDRRNFDQKYETSRMLLRQTTPLKYPEIRLQKLDTEKDKTTAQADYEVRTITLDSRIALLHYSLGRL